MGDGTTCHECRRYHCICLSADGLKLLRALLFMAEQYAASNPDVGWGSRRIEYAMGEIKRVGLDVSDHDINLADKMNQRHGY